MINPRKHLRSVAFYSGFPFFKIGYRRLLDQQRIFILMYHRVDHEVSPFFEAVVKPANFERQIRFLRTYYEIVDLADLKRLECNRTSKKDLVVLTFDDGYRDNYIHAFPILKKYQVPATIFLATGYINTNRLLWYDRLAWILYKSRFTPDEARLTGYDLPREIVREVEFFLKSSSSDGLNILSSLALRLKPLPARRQHEVLSTLAEARGIKAGPTNEASPMLSWEEVKEMAEHGISFGSHTKSHPLLSQIPLHQVREEIVESKEIIEEQIQKPVTTFAYPYGKKGDYSDHVVKILKDAGFEYACTTTIAHEQFPLRAPLALKRKGVALSPHLFL